MGEGERKERGRKKRTVAIPNPRSCHRSAAALEDQYPLRTIFAGGLANRSGHSSEPGSAKNAVKWRLRINSVLAAQFRAHFQNFWVLREYRTARGGGRKSGFPLG